MYTYYYIYLFIYSFLKWDTQTWIIWNINNDTESWIQQHELYSNYKFVT